MGYLKRNLKQYKAINSKNIKDSKSNLNGWEEVMIEVDEILDWN